MKLLLSAREELFGMGLQLELSPDRVAEQLQKAALDFTLWPQVLDHISRIVGGAGAILFSTETRLPGPLISDDLTSMTEDYIKSGWITRDERYRIVPKLLRTGIGVDLDFATEEEIKSSGYYQEFLAKHKRQWFAGLGFEAGKEFWCMSIQRKISQGPFVHDDFRGLGSILQALSDAATLSRQLSFSRLLGFSDGLELLSQPAALLDQLGRVIVMNDSAEALVGSMVCTLTKTLAFTDEPSRVHFERLIAAALNPQIERAKPLSVNVRSRYGKQLSIRLIPLLGLARFTFAGARVLMLIRGKSTMAPDNAAILQIKFGLTAAEARLAAQLGTGLSLSDSADQIGVTYATARSYLKSVFAKTDTRRQGQLVAVVTSCSQLIAR